MKCLTQANIQSNPTEFIKEARIMHAINHENIVRLFGIGRICQVLHGFFYLIIFSIIVLDAETQMHSIVTELAPMRSLLECLKSVQFRQDFLNVLTLCDFSLQICKGMEYLGE